MSAFVFLCVQCNGFYKDGHFKRKKSYRAITHATLNLGVMSTMCLLLAKLSLNYCVDIELRTFST